MAPARALRLAAVLSLVALLLPQALPAAAPAGVRPAWLRVTAHDLKAELPRLAAQGLDIAGVDREQGTVDLIADTAVAAALRQRGYEVAVVRYLDEPGLEVDSQYTDPGEMAALLASYDAAYPGLARLETLGYTEQGRPYYAMKISDNVALEEDEPAVFFIAQHHAREVMTPEVARDIIDYLLTRYASDAQVRAWVDSTEIWVMPGHNPDGTNHVFTVYDLWRKNRRNNGDGTFGVDLNRNYPFGWGSCGGSDGTPSSELYRGPFAASEPETGALMSHALAERPVLAITYHTYGEWVLYAYGCDGAIPPDKEISEDIGQRLARKIVRDSGSGSYTPGYGWALLYSVDGSVDDWFYANLGILTYTIEMSGSGQGFLPGYAAWRNSTVTRNRAGWQYFLDRLNGPSVRGHVTDACGGAPLAATVGIDEIPLTASEAARTADPAFGRYQRLLLLGDYHLRAGHAGYREQVWPVSVRTAAEDLDVALVPLGSRAVVPGALLVDDASGDGDGVLDPGETVTLRVNARATGDAVSSVAATLASADPYVRILDPASNYGSVAAGGEAGPADDGFRMVVDAAAPEGHVPALTVSFGAAEPLCAAGGPIEVPATVTIRSCPYVQPLNSNPGWTISNSTSGGWAFGVPTALSGGRGPGSGHTGANVYGTNLTGNYANSATYVLTTGAYNLSGVAGATLEFWRWISTEEGYDYATVEASADGATWKLLWTGTASDRGWRPAVLDASVMDGAAAARFRVTLKSDGGVTDGGVYLDDFAICGQVAPPAPRLRATGLAVVDDTANGACTDGDGTADAGEIVTLRVTAQNQGLAAALAASASLASSDPLVEVLEGPRSLGDVAAGGSAQADFLARVDSAAPCGRVATLPVEFLSNGGLSTTSAPPPLTLEKDGAACDANSCPAACSPSAAIEALGVDAAGGLAWAASLDPCHATVGIGYRVYRAVSAVPAGTGKFPAGTWFTDVSLADADGSLLDAACTDPEVPAARQVLYYLVTDVGSDGNRGPVGHYGE